MSIVTDQYPGVPVIIVTGTNEVETAVNCMRSGAFDYMVKPVEENRMISGIQRAIELRELRQDYNYPERAYAIKEAEFTRCFFRI